MKYPIDTKESIHALKKQHSKTLDESSIRIINEHIEAVNQAYKQGIADGLKMATDTIMEQIKEEVGNEQTKEKP